VLEEDSIAASGSIAELARDVPVEKYLQHVGREKKAHAAAREAEDRRVFRAYVDDCEQSAVSHQ
jgi:hypothetical protein